jgi:hypothetical protein
MPKGEYQASATGLWRAPFWVSVAKRTPAPPEGNILLCSGGVRGGSASKNFDWTEFVLGATAQDELI